MKRPRTGIRGRRTYTPMVSGGARFTFDDEHTCPRCGGPSRRSRCLLCEHVGEPMVVVRSEDGREFTLHVRDLLAGRWS